MNAGYDQFEDGRQPPNYAVSGNMGAQPQVVVTHPHVTAFVTEVPGSQFSWCHLVTAVIGFFCCGICGMVATVMSLLSYADHRVKDYGMYRSKRNVALGFGISAIVIGSLIWLGFIIFYFTVYSIAVNEVHREMNTGY